MISQTLDVVSLSPDRWTAYARFAQRAFGANAYQAQPSFLRWRYERVPGDLGMPAARIAVVGSEIVGCVHALRLPWSADGAPTEVVSLHDVMVAERHRTGVGAALLLDVLRGVKHALLIGAGPAIAPIYERLGAKPIATEYLRTVLNPVTLPFSVTLARLAPASIDRLCDAVIDRVGGMRAGRLEIVTHASPKVAEEIAAVLRRHPSGVAWTEAVVRWRFFDPAGPRHLAFLLRRGAEIRAATLVSLGQRNGLILARVTEWMSTDPRTALALAVLLRLGLTAIGVNVATTMTSEPTIAAPLRATGWWSAPSPPAVFELHRPRGTPLGRVLVSGGASDAGFDAIRP